MLTLILSTFLAGAPSTIRVVLRHEVGANTASCPDEGWMKGNVAGRLGFDPFTEEAPTQVVTAIEKEGNGFRGSLLLSRAGEAARRRTLTSASSDCRELAESLALAVAMAVDPQLLLRGPAKAAPPASEPAAAAPEPAKAPLPSTPLKVQGVLGPIGSAGLSPYPTAGARLGIGIRGLHFGLMLEARVDLPRVVTLAQGSVRSSVFVGSVLPCVHLRGGAICAQFAAGVLQIHGELPISKDEVSPLVLAGGRGQYELFPWRTVGFQVHVGVQAVLTRTSVLVDERPIWNTSPVALDFGLALIWLL